MRTSEYPLAPAHNLQSWGDRPYYSLDHYCKETYGHKCYKIALDAGMTCPNRDGTLGTRGCIFCSAGGSGDFAVPCHPAPSEKDASAAETLPAQSSHLRSLPMQNSTVQNIADEHPPVPNAPAADLTVQNAPAADLPLGHMQAQIEEGLRKFGDKKVGEHFIAYFQAYTNTYAPVDYLRRIYTDALAHPRICGISIATRPDCLGEDILQLFADLQLQFPDKFIWIELGLQTIHETTAAYIRRGYGLDCFEQAVAGLQQIHIPCIVHVILGLPGETPEQMYETIAYLNSRHIFGIKLQLLHILEGTDLAADYQAGLFQALEKDEYLKILIHCLELLSKDIVVHRVTGDGPKDILIAPRWSLHKRDVLNSLHRMMKENQTYQGRLWNDSRSIDFI